MRPMPSHNATRIEQLEATVAALTERVEKAETLALELTSALEHQRDRIDRLNNVLFEAGLT